MEKVGGVNVEILRAGRGRPVLFLHPHLGLRGSGRFIERLAAHNEVIAPSHPGFGGSELARTMNTVDDLSYFYLDLMEHFDLREVVLVGASFGGWIAAQIAVKTTERIASLALLGALGIKVGPRDRSDVADLFMAPRARREELYFHDAEHAQNDFSGLPDDEVSVIARNWESTARFGWTPYMHDTKLLGRLHRIRIPALVLWGAHDAIAPLDYGRRYAEAIPGARFETIAAAGHFPHIEQPDAVASRVLAFGLEKQESAA